MEYHPRLMDKMPWLWNDSPRGDDEPWMNHG